MNKKIISGLKALASNNANRSKSAQLREVIDEVEAALMAGVSRASIVEELKKNGLDLTMATFDSVLYRVRKSKAAKKHISKSYLPIESSKNNQNTHEESDVDNSSNPAHLDMIFQSNPDLEELEKINKRSKK